MTAGTNNIIANPFNVTYTNTDSNGDFDSVVNVSASVIQGMYDVRIDFNGSWGGVPLASGFMSNSSNRLELNVSVEIPYSLLFSINGTPTEYNYVALNVNNLWVVKRGEQLNLSVTLINEETMTPASGENIMFYDYTNGNALIGSDITDVNGNASISYYIGPSNRSGPTLVYAQFNSYSNYSYYIVNESIWINVSSYSNPLEVDMSGDDTGPPDKTIFNILCNLTDSYGNPITYSELDLIMNRSLLDYTAYLTPGGPESPITLGSNWFSFNRGVIPTTPVNNYTLRLEFNGSFNFNSYPYSTTFNDLPDFYNSTEIPIELRVYDYNDIQIYFYINGTPATENYDYLNKPRIFTPDQDINFTVVVNVSGSDPGNDDTVSINDVYNTNALLYSKTFLQGYEFILPASDFHPGIHKFEVQFESFPNTNTTFIVIDESITINVDPLLPDNKFIRNSDPLNVSGDIVDGSIGLRGLNVSLQLYNSTGSKVSQYLVDDNFGVTDFNGHFQIDISSIALTCPQGNYSLRIDFNGSIFLDETPGIGLIQNYMINTNSSLIQVNITAGTSINQDSLNIIPTAGHNPADGIWWVGDTITIFGDLTLDNGDPMIDMTLNVTIQLDYNTIVTFNDTITTNSTGGFNATFIVNLSWPDYFDDTNIIVYFKPLDNGLVYVEQSELEFFT